MNKYSYRGFLVSIHDLQAHEGIWKGNAAITTSLQSDITEDHQILIMVGASSEEMAYAMAARQCFQWVDEHIQ